MEADRVKPEGAGIFCHTRDEGFGLPAASQHQAGVVSAEAECVDHRQVDLGRARFEGHAVETAGLVLVVEVAVSSLTRDLVDKPPVYAQAGVPTYWVVDLDGQRAFSHESPLEGRYTQVGTVDHTGELAAPELGIRISLRDLLAAAAR